MHVLFEEHAGPQRAGGIEAATMGLVAALGKEGVLVTRRFTDVPRTIDAVPDCVHLHGIWSPTLALRFWQWRRRGTPCVVTVHGMLEPWALAHKRLKKQIAWHTYQKRLLNLASALHATSQREADNLRRLGLKPPVAMIPWGIEMPEAVGRDRWARPLIASGARCDGEEEGLRIVDRGLWIAEGEQTHRASASQSPIADPLSADHPPSARGANAQAITARPQGEPGSDLCPLTSDSPALLAPLGTSGRAQRSRPTDLRPPTSGLKTALFVGRIYPVKGLPMLVEAWAKVRPVGWKMKIVGPDEAGHLAEVRDLVRKCKLEAEFEFTGSLEGDALRQAYQDADLFILPSHTENFGMVVAEALSHGLPVIATNGTPWKGILDQACGWWPEISSDGIADALRAATSLDPTELRAMGARGRQWMQRDFSWEHVASKMAELYRSL